MIGMLAPKVFITYARVDAATVGRLQYVLERAGARLWIDRHSIPPGTPSWQVAIRRGIEQADILIYVASVEAAVSNYVMSEIVLAQKYGKLIIPFWVRGAQWADCAPFQLIQTEYVDARRERYEEGVRRLIEALGLTMPKNRSGIFPPQSTSTKPNLSPDDDDAPDPRTTSRRTDPPTLGGQAKRKRLTSAQISAALRETRQLQLGGRIDQAIAVCEDLLRSGLDRADIHFYVGFLYQEAERWTDAIHHYESSLDDPEYAVMSNFHLGQCARARGQMDDAVRYLDDAIEQLNPEILSPGDAEQLIQICYEAALAHRDTNDQQGARVIFSALLEYLRSRGWRARVAEAQRLMHDALTARRPYPRRRSAGHSHPLTETMPQRLLDAMPSTESTPINAQRTAAYLWDSASSGIWPTPPMVSVVTHPDAKSSLESNDLDGATRPSEAVTVPPQKRPTSKSPVAAESLPTDHLAQVLDHIIGLQGSLLTHLEALSLRPRVQVTRSVRQVEELIRNNLLAAAADECARVIDIAPQFTDLHELLAEIYVRQGELRSATARYVALADQHVAAGQVDAAIRVYQRILQLEPENQTAAINLLKLLPQPGPAGNSSADRIPSPLTSPQSAATRQQAAVLEIPPIALRPPVPTPSPTKDRPEHGAPHSAPPGAPPSENMLSARSLVDPNSVPQWLIDAPREETREAVDAMREIRLQVSSGHLDAAGQAREHAELVRRFRAKNQLDNAIHVLHEMARLTPDDPTVRNDLADILIARGHLDEGAAELRVLTGVYERRDMLTEAAQVYQRLADIIWMEHRPDEALSLQRQAVCLAPDDMMLRRKIVQYCLEIGRASEAIEQQAIIARHYFNNYQPDEAVAAAQQLIALDETNVDAYDMLGRSYYAVGEYDQAASVYRNLQKLDHESQLARVRLQEIADARAAMTDDQAK